MITVEQILTIIKNVCPDVDTGKIDPKVFLREYGIDSLEFFDIIVELQELLGKDIPDKDIDQLNTVSMIQEYFESQGR